ncbi:hypothetical protein FRC04_009769 [Tulasnella sp. 424]|nr:hypothetical protein FRC04_009769 [Tulasnella sp. 424]
MSSKSTRKLQSIISEPLKRLLMLNTLIRNIILRFDKRRSPASTQHLEVVSPTMPKDQLGKAVSFASPRNQRNNLQAARSQKPVSRAQSTSLVVDRYWLTKPLPFYSYRDVTYAVEGPDKITRTPQRVYIVTEEEANEWVPKLRGVIGFDMEWPYNAVTDVSGKTSMIQVSDEHTILLIHISRMETFPTKLKELIESPNIVKTGFWIANDCGKLIADLAISPKMCIELHGIAKKVDQAKLEKFGLFDNGTMNFAKMIRLYLEKELAKPNEVRISDWSEDLTEEHLEYAANDAHAGLVLYKALIELGKERQINVDLVDLAGKATNDADVREAHWRRAMAKG